MVNESKGKRQIIIEETTIVLAVIIAGFALQLFTGSFSTFSRGFSSFSEIVNNFNGYFNSAFLAFPVNIILIGLLLLVLFMKRSTALSRMASGSLSVILLVAVTLAALWMGLVPGNHVKISWPFVLLYLMLLINLIAVISLRIKSLSIRLKPLSIEPKESKPHSLRSNFWSFRNISFLLNHLGLLLILLAAGPGSADKARYFMRVVEGTTEWRGELFSVTEDAPKEGSLKELPLAIELIDFKMEEYAPKLAVIDVNSGESMPKGKGVFFEAIPNTKETIGSWVLQVDTFSYKARYAPSAFVVATDLLGDTVTQGWVSCGNYFQSYKLLHLTDSLCVAMTFPEPQSFKSQVKVFTNKGKIVEGEIRVNHPMRVGSWMIYQHSYDTQRGRDSEWSIFELIYDPWVLLSYIGFGLLMIGSVTLFWKGGRR